MHARLHLSEHASLITRFFVLLQDDDIVVRGEPYRELIIVTSGKGRSVPEEDGTMSPRADATQSRVVKDLAAAIEYVEGSFFGELVRTCAACLIV